MTVPRIGEWRLCFVRLPFCWFTTADYTAALGDDWDDRPWADNATPPSSDVPTFKVVIEGDYVLPGDRRGDDDLSVLEINAGGLPWLRMGSQVYVNAEQSRPYDPDFAIWGGCDYFEFIMRLRRSGGAVYENTLRAVP